jgi:hypothetical protein
MLKKLAVVVVVVILALVAYIVTRPSDLRVSRSRAVSAPPDVVFAHVNDFSKWPTWSPWEKLDPAMKREVSTPAAGTGASYHWAGNDQVGEGRMTITDSQPPQKVTIRLEFIKPWAVTNTSQFDFAPSGTGTNVTWTMTGKNNFMAKAVSAFMDMDAMIGKDFEQGLANLDAATKEAAPAAAATSAY